MVDRLRERNAVLICDETHHLSAAVIDQIRCVHDQAKCGLVLCGNDPLYSRLTSSRARRSAHLAHRQAAPRFGRPSDADILALAETLVQRAPGGKARDVVLAAGQGIGGLRAVAKLIGVAAVFARGDGREDIRDGELLEAAADMGIGG